MAVLNNSKRCIYQATYSSIDPSKKPSIGGSLPFRMRAWDKRALAASMGMSPNDVNSVRDEVMGKDSHRGNRPAARDAETQKILRCLSALETFATDAKARTETGSAAMFRDIEPAILLKVSRIFIKVQQKKIARIVGAHKEIVQAFASAGIRQAVPTAKSLPKTWVQLKDTSVALLPRPVYRFEAKDKVAPAGMRTVAAVAGDEAGELSHRLTRVMMPPEENEAGNVRTVKEGPGNLSVHSYMEWALKNNIRKGEVQETMDVAERLIVDLKKSDMKGFGAMADLYIVGIVDLANAFEERVKVEPVGFLHLERISFLPAGIERGELVYSLPMAPGEEVTVSHKEWADTAEEFERLVTDYQEGYSEEGVAEKNELAQSTSSQMEHSTALNTGVTAGGRFGPVNITATVGYDVNNSASRSEEYSRNQTIEVTRKASSRVKQEHKISFKVTTKSGTEDTSARTIKNPFADKTVRFDYYQLVRKWQVNLHRYGIRLTYDLTIPEPGLDILSKIQEIKDIRATLNQGFGTDDSVSAWARFDLQPDDITRENYTAYEAEYCTMVEPPPPKFKWYETSAVHQWTDKDQAQYSQYFLLEVDVDEDYEVTDVTTDNADRTWRREDHSSWLEDNLEQYLGKSGKMTWAYRAKYLIALYVEWRLTAELRPEVFRKWQSKAWNTLRDAAHSRYLEQRQYLKDRLAELLSEVGAQDALSLRKIEREEIMKGVLRWMFGPDFNFVPQGLPENLYTEAGTVCSDAVWGKVLAHSELIKFLHQAVEWENMIYLLYPYFWSHASRWEFKKYLDHPDPLHKVFLKAGSARVVLTIRPGFEKDFISLMENGNFERLPDTHEYITIAEEMENYANTNYPGIPPANPEEANRIEEGNLIGTWNEYSPTSALDIEMSSGLPSA